MNITKKYKFAAAKIQWHDNKFSEKQNKWYYYYKDKGFND